MIWREMDKKDLIYFKKRIDSIDWDIDFEKADKENYEILDRLCECIKNELTKNQKSKILPEALLLLADNVGCAEDFERYEENFVNRLEEEGLLTKELSELFRQNTNRRQGSHISKAMMIRYGYQNGNYKGIFK